MFGFHDPAMQECYRMLVRACQIMIYRNVAGLFGASGAEL